LPTSNIVTAWFFKPWKYLRSLAMKVFCCVVAHNAHNLRNADRRLTGERLPIIRNAVNAESKRNAILFPGPFTISKNIKNDSYPAYMHD
jgi:hypothetical protein